MATNRKKDEEQEKKPDLISQDNTEEKARQINMLFLKEAPRKQIERKDLSIISEEIASKYKMAVFERKNRMLKIAMVDPQNVEALNILRFIAEKDGYEIELYMVSPQVFQDIIHQYSNAEKAVEEVMLSLKDDKTEELQIVKQKSEEDQAADEVVQDAPVSKLVQVIIDHAIDGGASDIHIEPIDNGYRVRFRMDGILHSSLTLPRYVGRAVVSRIKILSNLKIDERRKPQDGRFKIEKMGRIVDFRISTFPVIEGEKVVLRVLDREEGLLDFETLGLIGKNLEILNKEIRDPYGIILITGPTGSGKTTTLYAFLQQ